MTPPVEYTQFRDSVMSCQDYASLPESETKSIRMFVHLVREAEAGREPSAASMTTFYGTALSEARRLKRHGMLAELVLPDEPPARVDPVSSYPAKRPFTPKPAQSPKVLQTMVNPPKVTAPASGNDNEIPEHVGFGVDGLLRVRVNDIKPNPINTTVFTSSLGEDSIKTLAEDIKTRKLQHPIDVTPDMVTPDGERRRRSLLLLGAVETYVRVVQGVDTPEQVEAYIWDSYSSSRDAALDERVKLYQLAQRVLQRRHGRPRGRPAGKSSSNDELFWPAARVKKEAAKRAGFTSDVIADRATSVFERAAADLLAQVMSSEVTISAAYAKLSKPKAPKPKDKDETGQTKDSSTEKPAAADTKSPTTAPDQAEPSTATAQPTAAKETTPRPADTTTNPNTKPDKTKDQTSPAPTAAAGTNADKANTSEQDAAADNGNPEPSVPTKPAKPELPVNDALAALQTHLRTHAEEAANVIMPLADNVGLDVWIPSGDLRDDLRDLSGMVRDLVLDMAANDHEGATNWVDAFVDELQGLIDGTAPDEDDQDGTEADEDSHGTPRKTKGNSLEDLIASVGRGG